jgi:hypothetical protein
LWKPMCPPPTDVRQHGVYEDFLHIKKKKERKKFAGAEKEETCRRGATRSPTRLGHFLTFDAMLRTSMLPDMALMCFADDMWC